MENKINIAKLLKNCPEGTKLYSTIFGNCTFKEIINISDSELIIVKTEKDEPRTFDVFGRYFVGFPNSECMLFPSKENRDWSKFQRSFKDGDVIYVDNIIAIFSHITENDLVWYHCYYCNNSKIFRAKHDFGIGSIKNDEFRLATEEEKEKLFQAIKSNGYRWNGATKTLEKLIKPKFKIGNIVKKNKDHINGIVSAIFDDSFKVTYFGGGCSYVQFYYQDDWKLILNKFDISILKPFDKVLVRHNKDNKWCSSLFSHIDSNLHSHCYRYVTIAGKSYPMCIPYEGNEHLIGKTDDCDDYYKIWEQ